MTAAPRLQALYSFFDPQRVRCEPIFNGVQIRSETIQDERVLEYIGKSQITGRHVFWNANAKQFEMVDEERLLCLKELV